MSTYRWVLIGCDNLASHSCGDTHDYLGNRAMSQLHRSSRGRTYRIHSGSERDREKLEEMWAPTCSTRYLHLSGVFYQRLNQLPLKPRVASSEVRPGGNLTA